MKRIFRPLGVLVLLLTAWGTAAEANEYYGRVAARHARGMSWHGPYYNRNWGAPTPLIVPPTAEMQTRWGWGVSQGTMTPIYHQFHRRYGGEMLGGEANLSPTPLWPSHTDQFGVYYLRGPW